MAPDQNQPAVPLDQRSRLLRRRVVDMLKAGGRGHLAPAFSLIEIMRVLYDDILRYDAKNPQWKQRDRCILSKGHGCMAWYVLLAEKGFFPAEELRKFCKDDGLLGGHPEVLIPGVEASTGSLGHGFSIGSGFALNAKYEKRNYRTFVIVGDGEINEGSTWEAALFCAKHQLQNLCLIIDYNKHQSYASTAEVLPLEPLADKFRSFGFGVAEVDGHDVQALQKTFSSLPHTPNKPTAVICHTIKGKGIRFTENNLQWHHKSKLSDAQFDQLYQGIESYPA